MMSKRAWATKAILASALLVGMGIGTGAYAVFFDSFDAGNLNNWNVTGDATTVAHANPWGPGQAAELSDGSGDATMFTAYRVSEFGAGKPYVFQFDYNTTGLSSFAPNGGFLDYFSASLYFSDTVPTSLSGLSGVSLMDANSTLLRDSGSTGVPGQSYAGGTVGTTYPGNPGFSNPNWYRFTLDYTIPINPLTGAEYLYAIPVFDLRSTNGVDGDSSVLIDNVTPEPITMVMLGCLGAGMVAARKLRRKSA